MVFQEGFNYHKAKIILLEICNENEMQGDFLGTQDNEKKLKIMNLMDRVNGCLGGNKMRFGAQGVEHVWQLKSEFKSPNYTTDWNDIPVVKML